MAGPVKVGRYLMFEAFAVGGTAQVHFGRLLGPAGFSRTFAIKRLHPHLAGNADFTTMLLDEARLAARIRHPSVVPVFEVVQAAGELLLVMEWIPGVSLARLAKHAAARGERVPVPVVVAIVLDALAGLDAAHRAESDLGQPLEIVHRDVSPQNVLVGSDGLGRVLDFGIAHATERLQLTRTGEVKGKLEYMAPEQVRRTRVDRRTDVYAACLVLWELFTGTRPHAELASAANDLELLRAICQGVAEPPSKLNPEIGPELDRVVMRGLAPDPADRFESAAALASALESACPRASTREVAAAVRELSGHELDAVAKRLARIEAYVPDGSEPSADSAVSGALDELLTSAPEPPRPPKPPAPITASYTHPPDLPRALADAEPEPPAPEREPPAPEPPPAPMAPPRRARLASFSAAAAALLGAALVTIAIVRTCAEPAPSVVAVEAPPRAAIASTAPAVEREPPSAPIAPSSNALPEAPRVARPSAAFRAGVRRPSKPKPDCSTPYVLDKDGVRIPKRECFH